MKESIKNKIWRGAIAWGIIGAITYILWFMVSNIDAPPLESTLFSLESFLSEITYGPINAWTYGFELFIFGLLAGVLYFIYGFPRDE